MMSHAYKRNELSFWLMSIVTIERALLEARWLPFQSHIGFPVFMTDGLQRPVTPSVEEPNASGLHKYLLKLIKINKKEFMGRKEELIMC